MLYLIILPSYKMISKCSPEVLNSSHLWVVPATKIAREVVFVVVVVISLHEGGWSGDRAHEHYEPVMNRNKRLRFDLVYWNEVETMKYNGMGE